MANVQLSALRTRTELILSVPSASAYVGSQTELDDINTAYEKTAYRYSWPHTMARTGLVITSNVRRYALPTNFRKAHHVKVLGAEYKEVDLDVLDRSFRRYAIDRGLTTSADLILSNYPTTTATTFTIQGALSAGSAVSVSLNSVSGLVALEEIFIDSVTGTDEFTDVSSIGTLAITSRLKYAKSANDLLYRVAEIIDLWYYRLITRLSAATDTMLLPDSADLAVPHYAAYLAYMRLEQPKEAGDNLKVWDDMVKESFFGEDKLSVGSVGQFVIG